MKTYRIKPVEWQFVRTAPWSTDATVFADTVFGSMNVKEDDEDDRGFKWRYCFKDYYDEGQFPCDSLEDGKAKAEAFYLERISRALEEVQ